MLSKKIILYGLLLAVAWQACTSAKPVYYSATNPDANGRVRVSNPHFKHKLNVAGIGATVGLTAAGAYAGTLWGPVQQYDEQQRKAEPLTAANAVVGGLLGFGIASLGNYLIGKQGATSAIQSEQDLQKWVTRYDRNALLLSGTPGSSEFRLIDRRKEMNYTVSTWQDAVDFRTAFTSNSPNRDAIVLQGAKSLNRSDLPGLLDLFPGTGQKTAVQLAYVGKSTDVTQAIEASRRYPDVRSQSEEKAFELVETVQDAATFLSGFPDSRFKKQTDDRVSTRIRSVADAQTFVQTFPGSANLNKVEKQAVESARSVADARLWKKTFPAPVYEDQLVESLTRKLSRGDLPELISLFYNNRQINKTKIAYIESAGNVEDFYYALQKYPGVFSGDVDELGMRRIVTAKDADDYMSYFPNSRYVDYAEEKLMSIILADIQQISPNDMPEVSRLLHRYRGFAHTPEVLRQLDAELAKAEAPHADKLKNMAAGITTANERYYHLIIIYYETQADVKAFTILPNVLKDVQAIDLVGPWVKEIYQHGASENVGLIFGRYEGSFAGDIFRYEAEMKARFGQNPYISKYEIKYVGANQTWERVKEWWSEAWSTPPSYNSSAPDRSGSDKKNAAPKTACFEHAGDEEDSECGLKINLIRVKCANGDSFKMYYWSRELEKKCDIFSSGDIDKDGYYQREWGHDYFLGASEVGAMQKGCKCK